MERGVLLDWIRDHLGQGVVVQCVQYRVGFLGGRRIRWQNILSDRSLQDLADTVAELCRSHARLDIPHRMVHVDEDGSDAILVSLDVRLTSVSAVGDVEGQDLVF